MSSGTRNKEEVGKQSPYFPSFVPSESSKPTSRPAARLRTFWPTDRPTENSGRAAPQAFLLPRLIPPTESGDKLVKRPVPPARGINSRLSARIPLENDDFPLAECPQKSIKAAAERKTSAQ